MQAGLPFAAAVSSSTVAIPIGGFSLLVSYMPLANRADETLASQARKCRTRRRFLHVVTALHDSPKLPRNFRRAPWATA